MLPHGTIGKNIKRFRLELKMTQGQLAEKVGVTMQAVSKWELGGTPDAELLPEIAAALGVSIDALFGRDDEVKKDPIRSFAYEVSVLPEEEWLRRVILCALAGAIATAGNDSLNDMIPLVTGVKTWNGKEHLLRLLSSHGCAVGNLTDGKQYIFMTPSEDGSYDWALASRAHYQRLFQLLSQDEILRILFFLMRRRRDAAVLTEVIAKGVGLGVEQAEASLTAMAEASLVIKRAVEGERGALSAWSLIHDLELLSVLMLLSDVSQERLFMINLELAEPEKVTLLKKSIKS